MVSGGLNDDKRLYHGGCACHGRESRSGGCKRSQANMVVVLIKRRYWCRFGNDEQSMERGERETLMEGGEQEGKDEEASRDCYDG